MAALLDTLIANFHNKALVKQAFMHPSMQGAASYERLEFLGDSVLGLIISEALYHRHVASAEGDLAVWRAALVSGEYLSAVARQLDVGAYLTLSGSEEGGDGRQNQSNLENALEAFIGALYLDQGLEAVRQFVLTQWEAGFTQMPTPPKDPKTALQEWAQGRGLPIPEYTLLETSGPSHAPIFTIEVQVSGIASAQAQAGSKKQAEKLAAERCLDWIETHVETKK